MKSSKAMVLAAMVAIFASGGFIAQLVRASHRYREVTGSNHVEVLNFSGFSTQLLELRP